MDNSRTVHKFLYIVPIIF